VVSIVRARASGGRVRLEVSIAPEVPRRVIGDPGRLRQVLLNLVGNALKFTEAGRVLISVATSGAVAGAPLTFEVHDTGIGLSEAQLGRLFQPFTQADASTTRRFGGTGLGLSISKRLVELMGGEIGVRSVEGVGSTFWFTLALPRDATPAMTPARPVSLAGVRTLVVVDAAVHRSTMRDWMREWGLRVETATSLDETLIALRAAASGGDGFRLAVIDYFMPGAEVEALGRAVRTEAPLARMTLILATATGQRGDADRFHGAGYNAYLTKPLGSDAVRAAMETALARQPGWSERDVLITRHTLNEDGSGPSSGGLAAASPRPRPSAAGAPQRPVRVLLAEDNPVNQIVAVKMLERLDCRVDVANDGAEALALAEARAYDLIFMDIQMPRLDGLETTRRIRAGTGPCSRVPIVAMTANALPGDRERCIDAGMSDYVTKPIAPESLREALERANLEV
jgi:CheY-like chemotaxis protein